MKENGGACVGQEDWHDLLLRAGIEQVGYTALGGENIHLGLTKDCSYQKGVWADHCQRAVAAWGTSLRGQVCLFDWEE